MLISKMGSKIWLDFIKWSKNCDFWFFRQNDENFNFWLWSAIAQKRKGFISYHHHFIHIQVICYNMTYRVLARFDPRVVLSWPHFIIILYPKYSFLFIVFPSACKIASIFFNLLTIIILRISIIRFLNYWGLWVLDGRFEINFGLVR